MADSASTLSLTSQKVFSASYSAYEHAQLVSGEGEYRHTNSSIQCEGYCTSASDVVASAGHMIIDEVSRCISEHAPDEGHMSDPMASQRNYQQLKLGLKVNQVVQCSDSQVTLNPNDHPATVMSSRQDLWFSILL